MVNGCTAVDFNRATTGFFTGNSNLLAVVFLLFFYFFLFFELLSSSNGELVVVLLLLPLERSHTLVVNLRNVELLSGKKSAENQMEKGN